MDDVELLAGIASRDERAMETLHERFAPRMTAVAMRVTRQERLAQEVVQDALMTVWRDPSRFDPRRGPLAPWLITLTRNKAIDLIRREATIQRHTAAVDLEFREAPDDVHHEVWVEMRRVRLQAAIATLPDDQRRSLEMAFLQGMTHVEVAAAEGIPLGTAKSRIRVALLKLRDELGSSLGDEPPSEPAPRPNREHGGPLG